jgi:hypothetical protein
MALDNVHRDEETPFYRIARITDKYLLCVLLKYEIFTSIFLFFFALVMNILLLKFV